MCFASKTSEIGEWVQGLKMHSDIFKPFSKKIMNLISYCRFLFRLLEWIWRNWFFIDWLHDDTQWYLIFAQCLSPVFSRPPFRVPGAWGEGRRASLAGGIRASRGAGAAPPSQSLFPECRAHPGAEGERERPGEGRRLLICTSKAANYDSGGLRRWSKLFQICS